MVQVPGDEAKLVGSRIEVEQEILAVVQDAVVIRQNHFAGEEPGKLVEIDKLADACGKVAIARGGHKPRDFDDSAMVFWFRFRLGIIDAIVSLPVVTEVLEEFVGYWFEEGDSVHAELLARPFRVWIFHHHVKSEQPSLEP